MKLLMAEGVPRFNGELCNEIKTIYIFLVNADLDVPKNVRQIAFRKR